MHHFLLDMLCCPACRADLDWSIEAESSEHIHTATATCAHCGADYPVHDDIALLLPPDLPRHDLWEIVESRLSKLFREQPDLEAAMHDSDNPVDQFMLAMVLEERGEFGQAKALTEQAFPRLYTADYMAGFSQQLAFVLGEVEAGPVVDLASGRGYLVRELLQAGIAPVVATDFSLSVLRRNRGYFMHEGLYSGLSLVACDARQLPFKTDSVPTMTSFLGLSNIEEPGAVIAELKRVISGRLLAICNFYAPDDAPNVEVIRQHNMLLIEEELLAEFARLEWEASLAMRYLAQVSPTPQSEVLGVRVDGLPVTDTTLVWGTLVAQVFEEK